MIETTHLPDMPDTFGRADFKPEIFDRHIYQKGYRVIWEQGMFCSCYSDDSGQPDYTCPVCHGNGYLYFDAKETRVLVTSISGRKEQERIGLDDKGSAYLTPMSIDNVGFRDRFTFLDFTTKFSQVIKRSYDFVDTLRYPAIQVIAVRELDKIYELDKHFKILEDRKSIEWLSSSNAPANNYSILYTVNPVYIVINPIHELRGTYSVYKGRGREYFVQLPKQFQIKREDFIDNEI